MPLNADQLLAVLPHPVLTKIIGEPNLASITLQHSEHNGNLASIKSNLGDGLTGLVVLSMKPDILKTIHPDAFEILTNPGPAPDPAVIAAASTATKIAYIYKRNLRGVRNSRTYLRKTRARLYVGTVLQGPKKRIHRLR